MFPFMRSQVGRVHRQRELGHVPAGLPGSRRLLGNEGGAQHGFSGCAARAGRLRRDGVGRLPVGHATEFHDHLRAGHMASGARNIPRDPPELVAEAVAFAISTGEAHVLVGDPPRPIIPGDGDGWSALLARQAPGAAVPRSQE